MIRRFLVTIAATALALWAADYVLSGFAVHGGLTSYLIAGAVLGVLNGLVRPIIKFITLPLILLTLGLFTIIINIGMLWLAAHLTGTITISGFLTLLEATFIISLVTMLFNSPTDE